MNDEHARDAARPSATLPARDEPVQHRSERTGLGRIQRPLQAGIAVLLLAVLVWRASPAGLGLALHSANPALLILAVLLNLPVALLYTLRTRLALAQLGHTVRARTLLPIAVLGNVAGALTPAASGETLRVALLRSHAGVGAGDGLAVVVYERAMSLGIMLLGTIVALLALLLPPPAAIAAAALALVALAAPALAARRIGPSLLAINAPAGGVFGRLTRVLRGSGGSLCQLLGRPRLQASWSAVTVAILALSTAQLSIVARSLAGALSPIDAWLAFGGSQLAGIATMIPLGLGTADGSLAVVLGHLGIALARGVLLAIVWRLATTIPLLLAGGASYLYLLSTPQRPSG